MRHTLPILILALVLTAAQVPEETPAPEPDVRLIHESDTRAYYRPCG